MSHPWRLEQSKGALLLFRCMSQR